MPFATFVAELDGTEDAERFRQLRRVLEPHLVDLTVVRVGRAKVDVYVIGRNVTGGWAGLRTTSVET